jgi:tripartite ATP-independent transporter DctM subunit
MATGLPIAFCFMLINVIGVFILWNGEPGLMQLVRSMRDSITHFTLLPVPLFILMGEVMFQSGISNRAIDSLDKWLGRMPGRLSYLAVGGGTLFATLSGSSMATIAMLGSTLVPEMEKRDYKKAMTLGPILGSAGLAIMIPPSSLGVVAAAIGEFSVGKFLVAIIVPGLLMAVLYATYITIRARLQPHLAPIYDVPPLTLMEKVMPTVRYILPLGFILFLVLGVIFLGIATPSEAAALGCLGTFILAAAYRRLTLALVKKALLETVQITAMVLLIMTGALAFSQIMSYTGASQGLVEAAINLPIAPIFVVILMLIVILFLGMFMDVVAIMMITLPIFIPIIKAIGFEPVWFGAMYLLNIEMATTSPPFGLSLFVMKGVAPPDTTMGDIYLGALPFLSCDLVAMILMLVFPNIVLWLPGLMKTF